ncbi:hypothetical protein C5Y96_06810 [Blastopirellula marina]|uniref:Tetratricopeptide repeat protein n=1 Tax=Blastopirellula marina TaxID=124 RepID=A0A2S8FXS7_9BACT|nr:MULTISPECIES: tetratricopeptide repeat protein [Pirellulaceae]PQO36870.1 hypothetical protein C5Y96_06810 [Blastopirellula marina]RCS53585.1 tetratricopeptide repeat protein [Bremerella cremea]
MPKIDRTEMRQARIKAKIVDLTKKIATEGKTAERFAERAELHVLLDQKHWAVVDYDDAIKLEPKNYALRDRRLELNRELENVDLIEVDLTALIELDKSAIRYFERGKFYVEQRENKKAIKDFTSAIQLDPKLAEAYVGRGRLIHDRPSQIKAIYGIDRELIAEAAVDFAKAVQLKPELIEPRRTLIITYLNLERYADAVDQATAILERIPDDPCAKYYRAKSYKQQKKYDLALADINELIEQRPKASKFVGLRAEIYRETNQVDKAIADYRHNIDIDGDNYATHGNLARYLVNSKRFEEAIEAYSKAIELNKYDQEIQSVFYGDRATAYLELEKHDNALKDFGKAAELAKYPSYYKRQLARGLAHAKRYEEANAVYEDMMDDNPRDNSCFEERARMFIVMGKYDKAMQDINTYLKHGKHDQQGFMLRAVIWARLGNEDEVQEDLRRAREAKKYWEDIRQKHQAEQREKEKQN